MKIRSIIVAATAVVFFAACGSVASGPPTLSVKKEGGEAKEVPVKSGGFYASTKSWSKPGKSSTSSSYFVCVANYDIDMSQGAISIGAKVSSDDQTKVCFSLNGEENGNDKTPPAAGTYAIEKRGDDFAFKSISAVSIREYENGSEVRKSMDSSKTQGEIRITDASADEMSGEIDLSDGENEIKGSFTAKAFKRS
ncbi:MAG: hypothetical protein IPM63_04240 [Acidobacteriota bacterium]|nr:MAG: hypothetical protein IPM63_04240 [Acidobacteriota bacterium]